MTAPEIIRQLVERFDANIVLHISPAITTRRACAWNSSIPSIPSEKAAHDKLVSLVERMLALQRRLHPGLPPKKWTQKMS